MNGFSDESDFASYVTEHVQSWLRNVSLTSRKCMLVKELPGFRANIHRVPAEVNSRTENFVSKLADDVVKKDLDGVFARLRSAFRFKRNEIESNDDQAGGGAITTPFFRYLCTAFQDPETANECVLRRSVSSIVDLDHLLTDAFAEVFGVVFDTVVVRPGEPIHLESIIDRIEEVDDDRLWVEYDRQVTRCKVTLDGCPERILITTEEFRIVHPQAQSPRILVDSLLRVQNRLMLQR